MYLPDAATDWRLGLWDALCGPDFPAPPLELLLTVVSLLEPLRQVGGAHQISVYLAGDFTALVDRSDH